MSVVGIEHVQLAMPAGREAEAREFYARLLGIPEIPKPPKLAERGGAWFERGALKIHLGVEADFRPARKAHPALLVSDLPVLVGRLRQAGVDVVDDPLDGHSRVYVADPFGNRIELMESSTMETPLLWHIPLSHFNEKVRWTLDYKAIAHHRRVLGPDYLVRAWRATGQGKLPILWLDGRAIADSTGIIAALEERYPEPPLYPRDAAARQRALALEDDFDETLGPALRAAIVTPLFRNDPDIALRLLTTGMPEQAYRNLRPLVRVFPTFYRFRHKISESSLEKDRAIVAAALERIEQQRQGRTYLVGDAFTVADLTAASLLGALLQPPEIQYPVQVEMPPYVEDYRETLRRHPAGQWAFDMYRLHRGRSAEVKRAVA